VSVCTMPHKIAPTEHRRDGLELNRRGRHVASCGEGAKIGGEGSLTQADHVTQPESTNSARPIC
jgi:hypothetical protein